MPRMFDVHGDPFASVGRTMSVPASASTGGSADGHAPDAPAETGPAWRPSPLLALRRHWAVAMAVAALVVTGGGAFVMTKVRPSYRAEAVMHVQPVLPRVLYTDEEWRASSIVGFYNDYMRTLVQLSKERAVLEPAVARLAADGVAWLPDGVPPSEAANVLRARLEVQLIRETNLLQFGFQDSDRVAVAPVVNAVVESFLARIADEENADHDSKTTALAENRRRLEAQLAASHEKLGKLADVVGSALLDERQNVVYDRVRTLEESHGRTLLRRLDAEGALTSARGRAAELRQPVPSGRVDRMVDDEPNVRDARVTLARLVLEVQQTTAGLAAGHPDRVRAERRVEDARAEVAATVRAARDHIAERFARERDEEAQELLGAAEREAAAAVTGEEEMRRRVEQARADLAEFGRAMFEGAEVRTEAGRLLRNIDDVDKRIEQLRVESGAPARISLRGEAVEPFKPAKDTRVPMLMGAAFAAVVAGLGSAFVLARFHPVVRGAADVRATGLDLLAEAPGASDPELAAETLVRLGATGRSELRALVLPASGGDQDEQGVRDVAAGLGAAAASCRPALVVDLLAEGGDDFEPGTLRTWAPRPAGTSAAAVVATPSFAMQLERAGAGAPVHLIAAPGVLESAASWPFLSQGWQAVLVAVRNTTRATDLAAAAQAVTRTGGRVAGVALVG